MTTIGEFAELPQDDGPAPVVVMRKPRPQFGPSGDEWRLLQEQQRRAELDAQLDAYRRAVLWWGPPRRLVRGQSHSFRSGRMPWFLMLPLVTSVYLLPVWLLACLFVDVETVSRVARALPRWLALGGVVLDVVGVCRWAVLTRDARAKVN